MQETCDLCLHIFSYSQAKIALSCMRDTSLMVIAYHSIRTVIPGQGPHCRPILASPRPTATSTSYPTTPLFFNHTNNSFAQTPPGDVKHEVILQATSKKKVKENEEIIWDEMPVLQGLDHPNIVRSNSPIFSLPYIRAAVLLFDV